MTPTSIPPRYVRFGRSTYKSKRTFKRGRGSAFSLPSPLHLHESTRAVPRRFGQLWKLAGIAGRSIADGADSPPSDDPLGPDARSPADTQSLPRESGFAIPALHSSLLAGTISRSRSGRRPPRSASPCDLCPNARTLTAIELTYIRFTLNLSALSIGLGCSSQARQMSDYDHIGTGGCHEQRDNPAESSERLRKVNIYKDVIREGEGTLWGTNCRMRRKVKNELRKGRAHRMHSSRKRQRRRVFERRRHEGDR